MGDYHDIVTRKAVDSTLLRVYPGAVVEIYDAGTANLVDSTTADSNGAWSVATLADGKYDIKVDSQLVRTIHHVNFGHTHKSNLAFQLHRNGAVTGDVNPGSTIDQVFAAPESGVIEQIILGVQHVDATGDVTVHLLKGTSAGGSTLAFATDSIWSHRVNPGGEQYRYIHIDSSPGLTVAANDVFQLGLDWTANTVEGVSLTLVYRPDA